MQAQLSEWRDMQSLLRLLRLPVNAVNIYELHTFVYSLHNFGVYHFVRYSNIVDEDMPDRLQPGVSQPCGVYASCSRLTMALFSRHSYPNGETCVLSSGCYVFPPSTTSRLEPTPSTTCPIVCNPAHSYPNGEKCVLSSGCYVFPTSTPGSTTTVLTTVPCNTTKSSSTHYSTTSSKALIPSYSKPWVPSHAFSVPCNTTKASSTYSKTWVPSTHIHHNHTTKTVTTGCACSTGTTSTSCVIKVTAYTAPSMTTPVISVIPPSIHISVSSAPYKNTTAPVYSWSANTTTIPAGYSQTTPTVSSAVIKASTTAPAVPLSPTVAVPSVYSSVVSPATSRATVVVPSASGPAQYTPSAVGTPPVGGVSTGKTLATVSTSGAAPTVGPTSNEPAGYSTEATPSSKTTAGSYGPPSASPSVEVYTGDAQPIIASAGLALVGAAVIAGLFL